MFVLLSIVIIHFFSNIKKVDLLMHLSNWPSFLEIVKSNCYKTLKRKESFQVSLMNHAGEELKIEQIYTFYKNKRRDMFDFLTFMKVCSL